MKYEVLPSPDFGWVWNAEAIDDEGKCYVVIFSGPGAEARAREYAAWKNRELPN